MEVQQLIQHFKEGQEQIPAPRRWQLGQLAALCKEQACQRLAFICTHNSRRSQLAEVLLDLMGGSLEGASAGTEATAFNERMVNALRSLGLPLNVVALGENPRYTLGTHPKQYYSKTVAELEAQPTDFIAVMVCTDADENCPVVPGALARFSLPYTDPKAADGRADEAAVYRAKVMEIGAELSYLLDLLQPLP